MEIEFGRQQQTANLGGAVLEPLFFLLLGFLPTLWVKADSGPWQQGKRDRGKQ
jgi:hypothetical protein